MTVVKDRLEDRQMGLKDGTDGQTERTDRTDRWNRNSFLLGHFSSKALHSTSVFACLFVCLFFRAMEAIFKEHHPKNSLKKGKGLFNEFWAKLKGTFPQYHESVLHLVTRIFTQFRIRSINFAAKNKKKGPRKTVAFKKAAKEGKGKKRAPVTKRGKRKLVEMT